MDGSEQHRKSVIQAAEVVGELAKYSFIGICYLGIAIGVSIKLGDRVVKTIKTYIPQEKKKEGDVAL